MIPLEKLTDGSATARNFDKLVQLVSDSGGLATSFRFGTTTVSFSASAVSTTKGVDHGLGREPVVILTNYMANAASTALFIFPWTVKDETSFSLSGKCSVAATADVNVLWLAIG